MDSEEPFDQPLRRALASLGSAGPHLSDESILIYLEGPQEEGTEAHLVRCTRCLDALLDLKALSQAAQARPPGGAAPRGRLWAPAAALLLITITVYVWRLQAGREKASPAHGLASGPASLFRAPASTRLPEAGGVWEAEGRDAEAGVGKSALGTLKRGSRIRLEQDPSWCKMTLERGAVRVESPGERVLLALGGLRAAFEDATVVAEISGHAPAAAGLLREAGADEGVEVRLGVLRGTVRVTAGSQTRELAAGQSVRFAGGVIEEGAPPSWREEGHWVPLGDGALMRDAARIFLKRPPEEGYVFEALIRKRDASAELGLLFRAAGASWEIPVGQNLLPPGEGWSRVRIVVDGSSCRATLGMRRLLSRPAGELREEASPSALVGVGLRVWGGDLETRGARWKRMPPGEGP